MFGLINSSGEEDTASHSPDKMRYAFVDTEVDIDTDRVLDIGAVRHDGATYHSANKNGVLAFIQGSDFVCGHNIVHHDAQYLFASGRYQWKLVDTLYISPLLFPEKPYHRLLKNDKLVTDQRNNPVNDCIKATARFVVAWKPKDAPKDEAETAVLLADIEMEKRD